MSDHNDNQENGSNVNLEQFVHAELRRLPDLKAPPELSERVMQALRHPAPTVRWRRPFRQWPAAMRGAAMATVLFAGILMLGGLIAGASTLVPWIDVIRDWVQAASQEMTGFLALLSQLSSLFSDRTINLWLWGAGLFSAVMFVMLVGVGSVLARIALARHPSPQMQ